ncbi:MAG: hypothetical protein H6581_24960 [Bacteroidia bacterium]|nr:hypothetical protein [Bacteroidia bacterium]
MAESYNSDLTEKAKSFIGIKDLGSLHKKLGDFAEFVIGKDSTGKIIKPFYINYAGLAKEPTKPLAHLMVNDNPKIGELNQESYEMIMEILIPLRDLLKNMNLKILNDWSSYINYFENVVLTGALEAGFKNHAELRFLELEERVKALEASPSTNLGQFLINLLLSAISAGIATVPALMLGSFFESWAINSLKVKRFREGTNFTTIGGKPIGALNKYGDHIKEAIQERTEQATGAIFPEIGEQLSKSYEKVSPTKTVYDFMTSALDELKTGFSLMQYVNTFVGSGGGETFPYGGNNPDLDEVIDNPFHSEEDTYKEFQARYFNVLTILAQIIYLKFQFLVNDSQIPKSIRSDNQQKTTPLEGTKDGKESFKFKKEFQEIKAFLSRFFENSLTILHYLNGEYFLAFIGVIARGGGNLYIVPDFEFKGGIIWSPNNVGKLFPKSSITREDLLAKSAIDPKTKLPAFEGETVLFDHHKALDVVLVEIANRISFEPWTNSLLLENNYFLGADFLISEIYGVQFFRKGSGNFPTLDPIFMPSKSKLVKEHWEEFLKTKKLIKFDWSELRVENGNFKEEAASLFLRKFIVVAFYAIFESSLNSNYKKTMRKYFDSIPK